MVKRLEDAQSEPSRQTGKRLDCVLGSSPNYGYYSQISGIVSTTPQKIDKKQPVEKSMNDFGKASEIFGLAEKDDVSSVELYRNAAFTYRKIGNEDMYHSLKEKAHLLETKSRKL